MKKILVIDDEPLLRLNLKIALQKERFRVVEAPDGSQGVDLARNQKPDLILCDITMPGKDGYTVLRELRADPSTSRIPFIFLSGKGQTSDRGGGANLGADDYLPKPVSIEDLLAAIASRLPQ